MNVDLRAKQVMFGHPLETNTYSLYFLDINLFFWILNALPLPHQQTDVRQKRIRISSTGMEYEIYSLED